MVIQRIDNVLSIVDISPNEKLLQNHPCFLSDSKVKTDNPVKSPTSYGRPILDLTILFPKTISRTN